MMRAKQPRTRQQEWHQGHPFAAAERSLYCLTPSYRNFIVPLDGNRGRLSDIVFCVNLGCIVMPNSNPI